MISLAIGLDFQMEFEKPVFILHNAEFIINKFIIMVLQLPILPKYIGN